MNIFWKKIKKNSYLRKIILRNNLIVFNKVYIWLGKNTHLSLHCLPSLFNLKNTKINFNNLYEKL